MTPASFLRAFQKGSLKLDAFAARHLCSILRQHPMLATQRIASNFATRRGIADQHPEVRVLYPPGVNAAVATAGKFARLVSETLEEGAIVELQPSNAAAMWHSLRALSVSSAAVDFKVFWDEATADVNEKQRKKLRLHAQRGCAWSEFDRDFTGGFFVSNETSHPSLARKLAMEFRTSDELKVHTYVDAEGAVGCILRALAMVPQLEGGGPLQCTAGTVTCPKGGVPRVLVHARKGQADPVVQRTDGDSPYSKDFKAYPPGTSADEEVVRRFSNSVRNHLLYGQTIIMECRGQVAVRRAMIALASAKERCAEFQVSWVDGYAKPGSPETFRALQVRAIQGPSWEDFNATNFTSFFLLRPKDQDAASVKDLAEKIRKEFNRKGGVAVHVRLDEGGIINSIVKAFASLPVYQGQPAVCIPSLGWSTTGDHSGTKVRSLRLFARPRQSSTKK